MNDTKISASWACESTEKVYHFKITYLESDYFYVVRTLECHFMNDVKKPITISIERGQTFWDCGKQLTELEENEIKRMIYGCFLQPFLK